MSNKFKLSALIFIALLVLILAIFAPYKSRLSNLDFYVSESNSNYQFEVGEKLFFLLNDTSLVEGRKVVWHMGNGDSIMKRGNIDYKYRKEGKYLVSIKINDKFTVSKQIGVVSLPKLSPRDSLVTLHGVDEGYVGEELVFFTEGKGINTWYWEFGETGTVDAYEEQVIYRYSKPGDYRVKLQTNTLKYPIYHNIRILPRFEKVEELEKVDSLGVVQNDIRKRLQAIADSKVTDRGTFYKNLNYIKNNYTCNQAEDILVIVNGGRYNDFFSYCQGLHYLENKKRSKIIINKVEIDTIKCFKRLNVTQSLLR
ncbi:MULTISPECIES: PKD domain-containing protein [Tenacibaculum]|uniref:PKD domain-containing protein n=1 Tax=Tenacibaculum discolor TaxID=361581 RepID=A0A2G1BTW7_9FLAO|nr:PKD domain-containing protein [Tenacibaculum discolor]MDP2542584.1 PKD domain-containing protein [Tenacibaculum discolor]PHN97279.1 PKD domain-containing protein [Tenacibaculum discolor]PHO00287.1 PKD domain-containing protein [Rhodobacteraceae bacterium 4F10]RLJ98641.1 hypothetical protein C8N27_2544 [Tenacibaculum discolor]